MPSTRRQTDPKDLIKLDWQRGETVRYQNNLTAYPVERLLFRPNLTTEEEEEADPNTMGDSTPPNTNDSTYDRIASLIRGLELRMNDMETRIIGGITARVDNMEGRLTAHENNVANLTNRINDLDVDQQLAPPPQPNPEDMAAAAATAVAAAIAANPHLRSEPPIDITAIDIYAPRPEQIEAIRIRRMWEKVRQVLPRARHEDMVDAESRPDTNLRNRTHWGNDVRLTSVNDPGNLQRIQAIEDELFVSLLPYRAWPQRIIPLLSEDFQAVRMYLEENPGTTWVETLILLCQRLKKSHSVYSPWYLWLHLHPFRGELQLGYARRIRAAFYGLGREQQREAQTRGHLVQLIRDGFPTIWGQMQAHEPSIRNIPEIIDELILRAENDARKPIEAIYTQPSADITVQNGVGPWHTLRVTAGENTTKDAAIITQLPQQTPGSTFDPKPAENIIADPRTDDDAVNAVESETALAVAGNCYNCGRPGHWTKDCRQRRPTYNTTVTTPRQKGESGTFVGTWFRDKIQGATQRFSARNNRAPTGSRIRGRPAGRGGQSGRRVAPTRRGQYAVDEDEGHDTGNNIEAIEYDITADNYTDYPDTYNDVFNGYDSEEDDPTQ
jgi:hypothetical protein